MIKHIVLDDLYYCVALLVACVAAWDLGLLIGWLWIVVEKL